MIFQQFPVHMLNQLFQAVYLQHKIFSYLGATISSCLHLVKCKKLHLIIWDSLFTDKIKGFHLQDIPL